MALQDTYPSDAAHTPLRAVSRARASVLDCPAGDSEACLTSIDDHIQVLTCRGDIDLASAATVQAVIQSAVGRFLIIDLTDVPFMDAAGVGVLIAAYRRYPDGRLSVSCPSGEPRHVLRVTGMHTLFRVRDTVAQARRALDGTSADAAA